MADAHAPGSEALTGKTLWQVVKQSFSEFSEDKCPRLGAALSYYTILSLAPLLIIAIGIVGWMMGKHGTDPDESPVFQQLANLIGGQGTDAIKSIVRAASE